LNICISIYENCSLFIWIAKIFRVYIKYIKAKCAYHTHGLTHLHKHFEKLLITDIIVPHEVISLGVWYLHPSLFKHMRNDIHFTNEKYV